MNIYKSTGAAAGIVIGLIICFIVFKYANTNRKAGTEYDERQREIRGRGYKAAFYAAMLCEAVFFVLYLGNPALPFEPFMAHAAVIFVSCTVLGCYLIWNGAYWGLNNNRRRYLIIFGAALVLNAIPVVGTLSHGGLLDGGKLSAVFVNLLACLMLIVMGIVMLVRDLLDRRTETE